MSKYYGRIGFAVTEETAPGVWKEQMSWRYYYGDILKDTSRRSSNSEKLNDDIEISSNISIVADPFAYDNFFNIKCVELYGTYWKVSSVEPQQPRLILSLGGVYNGPTT